MATEVVVRRGRSGVVLLEAMVALAVFAVAGASIVVLSNEAFTAARRANAAERELGRASAFLDIVALWTSDDLMRRLGERRQGPWRLRIDAPADAWFAVALGDSTGRVLLRTEVYRPRGHP